MDVYRVDYNDLAGRYDRSRALSPDKEALWLALFQEHLGLGDASRVLDVGCGTGRFSALIAKHFRCTVIGIDPSPSMLAEARAKYPDATEWSLARGEAIPYAEGIFDVCLASQVVQHFRDLRQAFVGMYRVLQPGGRLGLRYSSHAQLPTILDYRFFPSALQIDCARLPDTPTLIDLMHEVGFSAVEEHAIRQELFESPDDYLQKLRNKYASVLLLISEEEYQEGLREAMAYVKGREFAVRDKYADITFLVGIK